MSCLTTPEQQDFSSVTVHNGNDRIGVVTLRGWWNDTLCRETKAVLREVLAARPAGLIIDLTTLHDADARSVPVWTRARLTGADIFPRVTLALCVETESSLARRLRPMSGHGFLPVFARVWQARVALASRAD